MEKNRILLSFRRRPGALATLALASLGMSVGLKPGDRRPNIKAVWENVKINPPHLNAYAEICDLREPESLSALFPEWFHDGATLAWRGEPQFLYPLYPLTLIFPLIMRILGHKKAPFMVFRTLNTRLQVASHRRIGVREALNLICETGATRIVPKGFEMDVRSVVQADHATAWESVHTFYYRGNFGAADALSSELAALEEPQLLGSWYLPDGIGLRFARISGDTNGIHYNGWYARRLGFDRALAQPILVLTRSLNLLADDDRGAFRLDAFLKGPVYYKSNVYLRGTANDGAVRFDVFCEDNPRPSLCCQITEPRATIRQ